MKLASLDLGGRDGRLALVSRDLSRAVLAEGIADTLQQALDQWADAAPRLASLSEALNAGTAAGSFPFDPAQALAPLPRAWQWLDGSAFHAHGELMAKVFNITNPQPHDKPLMYQGMSHQFIAPTAPVKLPSEADGIDFEGEYAVVTDDVLMGTDAATARGLIRLVLLVNDWSLRTLARPEMLTGFGWVQAKPACSAAPIAVTPDELGDAWKDGRVHLDLLVDWNGKRFGAANGGAMGFCFGELIAHAARTRSLCAGTIVGSGTVSNENFREVGSSCIAERRGIEIVDEGAARTGFIRFGDRVRMEVTAADGSSLFGAIDQPVVQG
ncbi:fumarylacetoacetate hydrolase [Niveispirillum sp. SYP-B3756]|uniref:fumarylacetoacetate hydrolase family protein n=1 Tax=Niveispirillum sp. SYP-B3756 TaxID=2662178 RepID=UPI001290F043|nr:fumarylacetoacetate hydrolase family protein [Niveispirillum sp. SYP-B3756]MQP68251.1 fumarylacetoacetate hydrolase [Niveispirillum sp. SYP-B3756]